ncbi:MAG TPA: DUF2490 domain-containing protein, partial [Flavisolibacter sp.]|nr:DUF2490 domain-containing protein [Flavisolibacter sp.]
MKKLLCTIFIYSTLQLSAQNDRVVDDNNITWTQLQTSFKLNDKVSLLGEYYGRRTDGVKYWQQWMLRTGLQIKATPQLSFTLAYAYIDTYPYGDYPIAANGTFPEHRLQQQVQLKNAFGKLDATQRIRIEQRFIGRRLPNTIDREIEKFLFSNRFRYMLRLQHPIVNINGFNLYGAAADEVFVSAGRNVGVNIFDQNRLMLLLGSKLSDKVTIEAGYINQTLMQGRRINNATIIQDNKG